MKILYSLGFLLVFAVALTFTLLNLKPVPVYFFHNFSIEIPLAVALTIELLAGLTIGMTVRAVQVRRLKVEVMRLEKDLERAVERSRLLRSTVINPSE